METRPVSRVAEIVVLDVEDETLIYDLRASEAHCLNGTAAFVWRHCNGENSITDICGLLEKEYNATIGHDFVWLALEQLNERNLLAEGFVRQNSATSRREMLKRVGMATVVAVPIIASIVAPRSAYGAASCACVNPGQCITQTTCPSTVNCNAAGICAP